MSARAIEARGLEKRFGPWCALSALDLEVRTGSIWVVLGANGAGKTTLLRVLAGLAQPTAGTLRIGSGSQERRARRARIGFVGHATGLYPALSVRENLLFAGRLHGVARLGERVERLLARLGLAGVAERPVSICSRGMAQRLAIARGLVHEPEIVLLDEPFTGLDRRSGERLTQLLRELREAGRTLLLTTHDLPCAARLADAALVLERGRVVHRAENGPLSLEQLELGMSHVASEGP